MGALTGGKVVTTVSRGLPQRPHLDVPKRLARELLDAWRGGQRDALDRIRRQHPKFEHADDAAVAAGPFRLSDAQLVIAHEFLDWVEAPRWHEARDVTPLEWARSFPDQSWANGNALRLLD